MSYDNWKQTEPYNRHNDDPGDEDDPKTFPCACGDSSCVGYNDDKRNIRIGKAWYAGDCQMANTKLAVIDALGFEER